MNNIERDKFLTEMLGECWHKKVVSTKILNKPSRCTCGTYYYVCVYDNIDFSTWEGFGKLWGWLQSLDIDTKEAFELQYVGRIGIYFHYHINPDRFAGALYKYLKENEHKT